MPHEFIVHRPERIIIRAMTKLLGTLLMATSMFAASGIHEFNLNSIDGKPAPLSAYKGKIVLVVNVASRCGYTPQYKGLEALYEKYKDQGFVIVGFPANNFHGQEPGTDQEIKEFCTKKYDVKFPMMSKISVAGEDQAPIYKLLTDAKGKVTWNFNKFLVGRDGHLMEHFDSKVKPEDAKLSGAIESALAAKN